MKKIVVLALALVMVSVSGAFALDSANVQVSATVLGTCQFNSPGTLPFGLLDTTSGLDRTVISNDTTFTCSNGTPYTITDDQLGVFEMTGPANLPYSFTYAAAGVGTGASVPLTITGTVAFADYSGAPAGVYTDTVVLTITP